MADLWTIEQGSEGWPARKTRTIEGVMHFLTPEQMAKEIVRLDAQLAACERARESLQAELWRQRSPGVEDRK